MKDELISSGIDESIIVDIKILNVKKNRYDNQAELIYKILDEQNLFIILLLNGTIIKTLGLVQRNVVCAKCLDMAQNKTLPYAC